MNLPIEFENQMKTLLGEDYTKYLASFNEPIPKSVHINTNRVNCDISNITILTDKISYTQNGYFINDDKIGSNPYHHAGIVYSQDAAAMAPMSSLINYLKPNERILDLCSSPGGKASQIATFISNNGGVLVANEINPSRNNILRSNIERMGFNNVLITKLDPIEIASLYPEYFTTIIVDAPCSGEGMFRKYEDSISQWSVDGINACSKRQKYIVDCAYEALSPGGLLAYSTCTYSIEENEDIIEYLITNYNMELVPQPEQICKITTTLKGNKLSNCGRRFYPHISKGEGQFFCILRKRGQANYYSNNSHISYKPISKEHLNMLTEVTKDNITFDNYSLYENKDLIIAVSNLYPALPTKGITMCGLIVGEKAKNRINLHHHYLHAATNNIKNQLALDINDDRLYRYLHGEEINDATVKSGYGIITLSGASIGGFKNSNGRLKNHYPKGLRNNN